MHCAYLALQVRFAVLAWKVQKKKNWLLFCSLLLLYTPTRYWQAVKQVYFIFRGERVASRKKNSEEVWLACAAGVFFGRANVFARESPMMAATTIRTQTRLRPPIGVFPALLLRAALHYPNAWNGLCQHGPREVGLLKSHYGSWSARRHD